MIDILVNQLDEHNEGNILATKEFNPNTVYYIGNNDNLDKVKTIREYYKKNFPNVTLKEVTIQEGDNKSLENIINQVKDKKIIVNLTGGKRINSLILLDLCTKNKITALYIDIRKKIIYEFKNGLTLVNKTFEDLEIEDIIKASGGSIVEDSSNLCNKQDLIYFSQMISKNLPLWHQHKQKLYEASIFQHDNEEPQTIYIHTENLEKSETELLNKILIKLKEMKEITFKYEDKKIEVKFLNTYLKAFIFKSGTWLEIETNRLVNSIEEVDESKNGVMFLWNNENRSVRNEVDVVAIKDSIPIFISCKDSDKYNEMALNELNVYAAKFGGNNAYKVLVATKEPLKSPVKTRAKEMGINIIIFDGDESKFIKEFKNIIKKIK